MVATFGRTWVIHELFWGRPCSDEHGYSRMQSQFSDDPGSAAAGYRKVAHFCRTGIAASKWAAGVRGSVFRRSRKCRSRISKGRSFLANRNSGVEVGGRSSRVAAA